MKIKLLKYILLIHILRLHNQKRCNGCQLSFTFLTFFIGATDARALNILDLCQQMFSVLFCCENLLEQQSHKICYSASLCYYTDCERRFRFCTLIGVFPVRLLNLFLSQLTQRRTKNSNIICNKQSKRNEIKAETKITLFTENKTLPVWNGNP